MRTYDMAAQVAARRQELKEFETNAEKAAALSEANRDLSKDVDRLLKKQAALEAIGDGHIETPQSSYDERWRMTIAWQPVRSLQTGRELAAKLEPNIQNLRDAIAANEATIERLLARP